MSDELPYLAEITTLEVPRPAPPAQRDTRDTDENPTICRDRAQLIVLVGTGAGRTYVIEGDVVIGRAPEAEVSIASSDVSRQHARIRKTVEGSFVLADLQSRNGTLINGVPVKEQALRIGDKIRIGAKTILMFTQYDDLEDQLRQSQKLESIGQLAGGVAHDFNNLLGVVLANVSYLQGLPPNTPLAGADIRECLGDIETAGQRAAQLTKQLLTFARRDGQRVETVEVGALFDEVRSLVGRIMRQGVTLTVCCPPELAVSGDGSQLHQVLMNLCVNARDAMLHGGTLAMNARRLTLSEDEVLTLPFLVPGDYALLTVSDTGQGMEENVRRRIFEPFFTTKQMGQGTGMGLAIAYRIVKNHGGHIQVQSKLGAGTTFQIYLPATTVSTTGRRPAVPLAIHERGTTRQTQRGMVLIVEDEEMLRSSTRRLLEGLGYPVLCAADGDEGVAVFGKEHELVALVLLDMIMPRRGGVETFHELRRLRPDVRVILTTGYAEQNSVRALLAAGAVGFLPKPYDAATLTEALASALAVPVRAAAAP